MIHLPTRERDVRYLVPALALGVFVISFLGWAIYGYLVQVDNLRTRALADWRDRMALVQILFETPAADLANDARGERAITTFNSLLGLRALVLTDAAGAVVQANRRELLSNHAGQVLPGFDTRMLDPQHLARDVDSIALDRDGHIRAYYPIHLSTPGISLRPAINALLYLDIDTAAIIAPAYAELEKQAGIFALIVSVTLLGAVLVTRRYINRPLAIMSQAILSFRPGQPYDPIPLVGSGPLSRLAREFERGALALNQHLATSISRGERLNRTLESIGDGVIITDAAGCIERLNQVAETLTGWSREAARGQRIDEVFAPFDATRSSPLPNPVLQVLETEAVVELANHAAIESRSGQIYQIADTAAPIRNVDGVVEGVVLVFHDVTEAYRLREDQRVAAVAFETGAPQAIADRDGTIIRVNRATLALGGFAREEILGANLAGTIYIGQESPGLREFFAGASPKDHWTGPTWWRNKQGDKLHVWVHNSIIRDEEGEIAHYVITAVDTTELVKTSSALGESRENYQLLIQGIHDGVAIIQDQVFVDCNQVLTEQIGRPRDAIIGQTVAGLSMLQQTDGSDSATSAQAVYDQVMAQGDAHIEWRMQHADGRLVMLEATLSRISWQGQPALLSINRDITERHQHEQERMRLQNLIEQREQVMRLACSAYGVATWELDVDTGALAWVEGAETVLGTERHLLPPTLSMVMERLSPDDRVHYEQAVANAVAQQAGFAIEFATRVPDGNIRWFRSRGEFHVDPNGDCRIYGATADTTEQRRAQQDIEQLAFHDSLTGLANRRLFLDRLAQASRHAQRSGLWGAVLFIDVDRFKLLNDSLGHAAGDALLREVGSRCEDTVREADSVARLGGDEFVILITELGDTESQAGRNAEQVASKLRARLDADYLVGDHAYHLSASIGIAMFCGADGEKADELLRHADVAMYQVKQRGRNAVAFYQANLQDRADRRLTLERELRLAIDRGELLPYFQPKVVGGTVIGAETLLRWQHPERGLVSPLDFIPIAEETGLIFPIGKQVMREACVQLQRWQTRCPERALTLAVNVSPHQFRHPDFLPCVTGAVSEFGIPPNRLIIEITEGAMLENIDLVIERMRELKSHGVGISVDDFGTGYSSLYYLKHLPLDEIKIDQSYVCDLLEDANDAAIVESIIAIANNLKLRTVAEGVETVLQADKLRAMGCLVHQGYFYARPLPLAEFEAFAGI